MSFSCTHCRSDLKKAGVSVAGGRCDVCGNWSNARIAGRSPTSPGIHPALARRYEGQGKNLALLEEVSDPKIPSSSNPTRIEPSANFPRIPSYEILACIGKGAMGSVYRARHLLSGREAAVKILSLELSSHADLVARFEREIAALKAFRHPNIVAIYDSGKSGKTHYYCMEYIHGTTLRRYLRKKPLSPLISVRYMSTILRGLKAAHERGIVHRDLKPENVLVQWGAAHAGEERLVLVDFGLAGILDEKADPHPNLTQSRVTMGTVNYMAPEQHTDAKKVDFRTDLYACGVILYESLIGDWPIGRFLLPGERGMKVPASLDACVAKALARSAEERYQSAEEFEADLKTIEAELLRQPQFLDACFKPEETDPSLSSSLPLKSQISQLLPPAKPQQDTSLSLLLTTLQTHYTKVPPWATSPLFFMGIGALVLGLLAGVILSRRVPQEVALSATRALPADKGLSFMGPSIQPLKPMSHGKAPKRGVKVDSKKQSMWSSQSPVWQYQKGTMGYVAGQGEMGHFRRDISFATSSENLLGGETLFSASLLLESVRLPLDPAKAQHLAREALGGPPQAALGGVFFINSRQDHAVGMVSFKNGSCGLAELRYDKHLFQMVQYIKAICRTPKDGKAMELGIKCNLAQGNCQGFVFGQSAGFIQMQKEKPYQWHFALGCRNINCLFDVKAGS